MRVAARPAKLRSSGGWGSVCCDDPCKGCAGKNNGKRSWDLPVAGNFEFDAFFTFRLLEASLLVDVDFLVVLGTTEALLLSDADLFLDVSVAVVLRRGTVDGGCEGFVDFFVTFPSV